MDSEISEFSYGFSLTHELCNHTLDFLVAAPEFPTQYQEGQEGGGYDVFIPDYGYPLFLQFKRAHCLVRGNAREAREDLLSVPYYRFHLYQNDNYNQNELLRELEETEDFVFYAAPEFHTPGELTIFFRDKDIAANSAFFRPTDVGELSGEEKHYIVYESDSSFGYVCSEPKKIERFDFLSFIDREIESEESMEEASRLNSEFFGSLISSLVSVYFSVLGEKAKMPPSVARELQDLEEPTAAHVSLLAQTLYDCRMLIVGNTESPN